MEQLTALGFTRYKKVSIGIIDRETKELVEPKIIDGRRQEYSLIHDSGKHRYLALYMAKDRVVISQLIHKTLRECKIHGKSPFVLAPAEGRYRCCKCRVDAVSRRRRKVKQKAINYLGGCCERCGYDKFNGALQFHHKDPSQKDFSIGYKGHTLSWSVIQAELDKCMLLCSNCHAEVHNELYLAIA